MVHSLVKKDLFFYPRVFDFIAWDPANKHIYFLRERDPNFRLKKLSSKSDQGARRYDGKRARYVLKKYQILLTVYTSPNRMYRSSVELY